MTEVNKKDAKKQENKLSKRESLIEEIKKELETYFLPSNMRQDAYLSSNMTADGYIDIKLLTRIKLIENLISTSSNSEVMLIEAIRKSKILKMNSQETMVKYKPLIERKTLIIRDLPSNTPKKDVLKIFDNKNCSKPISMKSDIADHWFISFDNEDDCSKTCLYLQNYGKYKGKKLNVRIKTVTSSTTKSESIYSPEKYPIKKDNNDNIKQVKPTTLFNNSKNDDLNIDTQKIAQQIVANAKKKKKESSKKAKKSSKTVNVNTDDKDKQEESNANIPENECDYPGEYMRYTRNKFLKICNEMMKKSDLKIPETMRGRDNRIVSEKVLIPVSILPKADTKTSKNGKSVKKNDKNDKNIKTNKKSPKKNKNYYNQRRYDEYYYDNTYNNQYYNNQRYNNNYNNYYNNGKQYKQQTKYYKPKNSSNKKDEKKSNKNKNNDIIYAPTGKRNYYRGWKPKNAKSS